MGVVYEAVQESLGRHVALKILPRAWRLSATQIERLGFSPDGRLLVVADPGKFLRLVETPTGRPLARLTGPDLGDVGWATFSPDGSRLVVSNLDAQAVQVWNLRAVRAQLAALDLDWDAPDYSGEDPAGSAAPPLPALPVDYGTLADHLEVVNEPPAALLERWTARLKQDPDDAHAHHLRAHALMKLRRLPEAIEAFDEAIRL
jgi:hypothetical protein